MLRQGKQGRKQGQDRWSVYLVVTTYRKDNLPFIPRFLSYLARDSPTKRYNQAALKERDLGPTRIEHLADIPFKTGRGMFAK